MRRLVYLAGPIDSAADKGRHWREEAQQLFAHHRIACFNPYSAFSVVDDQEVHASVRSINRQAIAESGLVMANLLPDTRMLGTIREIEYACFLGKNVVVAADSWIHNHVDAYDLAVAPTLPDAYNIAMRILDAGSV